MFAIFNRNKHVGIRFVSPELAETRTGMVDTFHQAEVTLQISIPDKVIVDIHGSMDRSINPECPQALRRLAAVEGAGIGSGVTSFVDRVVGGPQGCLKLAGLVLDAVQLATIGIRQYLRLGEVTQGKTPEEEVRYLLTVSPEMRNICPPYADTSPYLQGQPLPAPQPVDTTAIKELLQARRMEERDTQFLYLSRNKTITVESDDSHCLTTWARLDDFRHTMEVEMQVELPELEITRITGRMPRIPYPYCAEATLPKLRKLGGTRIAAGLTRKITYWAHREICFHYNNLILEACHAAIEATLGLYTRNQRLPHGSLETAQQEWLADYPVFRGSCLAYPPAAGRQACSAGS